MSHANVQYDTVDGGLPFNHPTDPVEATPIHIHDVCNRKPVMHTIHVTPSSAITHQSQRGAFSPRLPASAPPGCCEPLVPFHAGDWSPPAPEVAASGCVARHLPTSSQWLPMAPVRRSQMALQLKSSSPVMTYIVPFSQNEGLLR